MRYYLGLYTRGEESLWKIVDLLSDTKMLPFLCEDLESKGKKVEALAIMTSKNIIDQVRPDVREKLKDVEVTQKDFSLDGPEEFPYGPLSQPSDSYFHLPDTCKVSFISNLEELKQAYALWEMEVIGVDCEWRPNLVKFTHPRIALMQVGNLDQVFLFDMIVMNTF